MKRMGKKGASMVVAAALMAMLTVGLMFASAQPPQPFTIKGNVTYMNNGTRVPAGWTVNISDLTKGWSISTTTVDTPPVVDYNYKVDISASDVSAGDILEVYAEDPSGTFYGSTSHTITESEISAGCVKVDVSVKEKDAIAPTTNVTAPPTLWPGKPNETTIPSGTILPWTNETVKIWFFRTDNGGSGVAYTNLSLAAESETDTLNVTISNNSWAMDRTLKKGENVTVPFNEIFGEYFNVTISKECNATIEYYSVDNADNPETPKTVTVRIKYPTTGNVSINEIMYAPNEEWGGQYNEWIELYNKDDKTINLAGWEIDGKEIPDGTIIQPRGYLIIARNDTSFAEIYPGAVCSVVKVSIELNNEGEELFLKDSDGKVVDSVNYTPYADGNLGKRNGKTLERNETAWEESIRNGGTPCQRNSVLPPTSFVIDGYVFYEDSTPCDNPTVKITNDKIGEWFAENSTDSNYYRLTLKSTAEVMAGDTLRIDASSPDGTQINVTMFVVTQADIDKGGVRINITLEQPKLNEIKVTPQSAVVTVNTTKEFIATAYDQYGNPLGGVFIYWTSTNKTVGTVSPAYPEYVVTGPDGNATAIFTALAPGNTTVVAGNQTDAGLIIGQADVTVIPISLPDTIPPTTEVTTMPPEPTTGWWNSTVMLTFHRYDNGGANITGVNYTAYNMTGANATPWTIVPGEEDFTVNITAEGNTTVYYFSEDKAGNRESIKSMNVSIDKTSPDIISVNLNKTEVYPGEKINVTVKATDALSRISTVTAEGVPLTYSPEQDIWYGTIAAAPTPGTYNVTVEAIDFAWNIAVNDTVQYVVKEPSRLERIVVEPSEVTLNVGETKEFIATAYDQYGNPLGGVFIYWTSTNKTVGTVSPAYPEYVVTGPDGNATAIFTALAPGNTTVVAGNQTDAGLIIGQANVTVISAEYGVDLIAPANETTLVNVNATYEIVVKNTGNVADTFNLSVFNLENAAVANLSTYQVTLDAGANTTVLLNVTDETPGTYNVSVYAESVNDTEANDTITIMTTVQAISYGVNLTVDAAAKSTVEGVNATYILTVNNTGNVADNYTLRVDNPDNATVANLSTYDITNLAPGENFTVLLNVTNETAGTFRVNVTATSQGNTSVFDYVNTTTTVEEIKYGVDLIAPANETTLVNVNATYEIVVKNTGNVADTFNLSVFNLENAAVANLSTYQVTLDAGANTTVLLNVTDETPGTYNVSVYAESVNDTEANDTITIMTTVQAISYGVNLTVDAAAKSTVEGVNATYILTVNNTGNVADNYTLVVENPDGATTAVLSGNVTPIGAYTYKTVDIEGGESVIVLLNVTNETAGTFRVNVTANSTGDPSKFDYVNTTTTVSVPVYGVNLTVEGAKTAAKTTTPNANATYILTVKNTGNVADNYMLSITYNETTAWLNRTSITNLAPGATQDVLLNVSSLTPGIFVVNVTVNSTTDPNSTDTISTATIVLPINITAFAVDSTVKRSHTLNASVTIRNEGSSAINVTVVVSGLQNETGYPIVGTGVLVNLGASQEITLPVLVYVPATADIGNYTLFADAWLYEDYPDVTKAIGRGPDVTSVTS